MNPHQSDRRINTQRLVLLPLCEAHFDDLYEISKNPVSIEDYQRASENRCYFLSWIKDALTADVAGWTVSLDGNICGLITLENIQTPEPEIGFFVAEAFQKKGIASEALVALLADIELNDHHVRKVVAHVTCGNFASDRLLIKSGFRAVRTVERNWEWRGVLYDSTEYVWYVRN